VTNEHVKIEKYRAGLQHDLKQLCRASSTGARWARLQGLMQYATLQWPMVRIAKSKKSSQERTKVGRKRKASGSAGAKGTCRTSKPKGQVARCLMSNIRRIWQRSFATSVINHIAENCPRNKKAKKGKGGKVEATSGSRPEDEMFDGDFYRL
jgi:hypothetical protein